MVGTLDGAPEECSSCVKGTCRSFNGLYTRSDLPLGYSVITQIPKGACKIFVQQLKFTKNFLGTCIRFFIILLLLMSVFICRIMHDTVLHKGKKFENMLTLRYMELLLVSYSMELTDIICK